MATSLDATLERVGAHLERAREALSAAQVLSRSSEHKALARHLAALARALTAALDEVTGRDPPFPPD